MAENTPGIEVNWDPAARTSQAAYEGTLSYHRDQVVLFIICKLVKAFRPIARSFARARRFGDFRTSPAAITISPVR
jgi:hypothetical protein